LIRGASRSTPAESAQFPPRATLVAVRARIYHEPVTREDRRKDLVELYHEASGCTLCPLAEGRTNVVFGAGNADADLMFVGEAPGAEEDRQGLPFVGRAGSILTELLGEIDLNRDQVFIANVLKCLRYNAQVQLEDGSWECIGRLVRSRYSGRVMSVDEDGHLVPRRAIGWHATPVGTRRVFHLTYRSAKKAGAGRVGIELTGDHPVLTERGYVHVEALEARDRIATGQGLSAVAHDVACGTVLGDGYLNKHSAHLAFGHSQSQLEYATFKAQLLAELEPRVEELSVAAVSGGAHLYPVVHVRTLASRALRSLRSDFYRSEKIVPGWLEDSLNERMLAFWFMDDGHTRIRPPRQPSAEIATVGFDGVSLQILLRGLQRLGLPAKALGGRLHFDVTTTRALSERIAPFVPPSMRYKLHPDVRDQVPFDPKRLRPEAPEVQFDEVEVTDVTDRLRADTTFFCIDVEGTNNFVTAGGVVHNCRPPGNRDPQPIEIDSCRPYLHKQVELIQPRVIATLGNFATRLLTGSRAPISKVRGAPQVHSIAGLTVFLMPLFHPAAALRTPSLLETLREDFRKLPALLEERPPEMAEAVPAGTVAEREADQLDLFG
jgi:uracil-DNA glycosylase family 4